MNTLPLKYAGIGLVVGVVLVGSIALGNFLFGMAGAVAGLVVTVTTLYGAMLGLIESG